MPSGTTVKAEHACFKKKDCYLNIHVYPLSEDYNNAEGLCGNFNGDDRDDLKLRGSNTMDNGTEPVAFAKSYM